MVATTIFVFIYFCFYYLYLFSSNCYCLCCYLSLDYLLIVTVTITYIITTIINYLNIHDLRGYSFIPITAFVLLSFKVIAFVIIIMVTTFISITM